MDDSAADPDDEDDEDDEDDDDRGRPTPARYPARNVIAIIASTAAHDQGCADDLRPREPYVPPGSIPPCLPSGPW